MKEDIGKIVKDFFFFLLPMLIFAIFLIEFSMEEASMVWKLIATFSFSIVLAYVYCEGLYRMKE
jgi:hypothetical protein